MEKVVRNTVKKHDFIYCIHPAPSSLFLLSLSHISPFLPTTELYYVKTPNEVTFLSFRWHTVSLA